MPLSQELEWNTIEGTEALCVASGLVSEDRSAPMPHETIAASPTCHCCGSVTRRTRSQGPGMLAKLTKRPEAAAMQADSAAYPGLNFLFLAICKKCARAFGTSMSGRVSSCPDLRVVS